MSRKSLIALIAAVLVFAPLAGFSEGKAGYAGKDTCATCHADVASSYAKTAHANSLAALKNAGSDTNAECLACHTTGLEGSKYVDGAVTCEACHGPGAEHAAASADMKKTTINAAPDASTCTKCHTADWSPNFKFDEYKAKGVHAAK